MKTICCLVVLLIGWLKGEGLHAADKTRIAVTNFNLSYLPVGVAIKRGFFKDEGLDVEVIRMNTPNTVTAMITGDVGYTMLFGSVIRAALRGMPLRAMASLLDSPTYAFIARAEFKSLNDLTGSTVGIANFGGTDEVTARLIFKSQGIDADRELKFIAVGTDRARLAALKERWSTSRSFRHRVTQWDGRWGLMC